MTSTLTARGTDMNKEKDPSVYTPPESLLGQDDHTHRKLKGRHIQLIGIGGSIGTILFTQIGSTLPDGGPASLILSFILWSTVVLAINECLAEMVIWIPVSSPYIRFSDRFVDPALGFCAGVNVFVGLALGPTFEIVAMNLMLQFWTDKIPVVAVIVFMLVTYTIINVSAVNIYGECEFWLSIGKVILVIGLALFTFFTMIGVNPAHDAYGFRNWNPEKVPGTPFVEYLQPGSLGTFMGFISCLTLAQFTVCGPEYTAMVAGEAENPRKTLTSTFNKTTFRLFGFYLVGALSVGILLPYNDPGLRKALVDPSGIGFSPYTIAMENMGIKYFPHVVNLLIMLSIYSAGNSYFYFSTRILLGLALEGKMPKVFTRCTKDGVPLYCIGLVLTISMVAFLQVSNGSGKVISWLIDMMTPMASMSYAFMALSYIKFYEALKVQGIDRATLPYRGRFQPYAAYYALIFSVVMTFIDGYTVFLPGHWNSTTFIFAYIVPLTFPFLFLGWKVWHRTKWVRAEDIDLFKKERKLIDEYERDYVETPPTSRGGRFFRWLLG